MLRLKLNKTMKFKSIYKAILLAFALAITSNLAVGESVGVYFNSSYSQCEFAANDIKSALESKGLKAKFMELSDLTKKYKGKKIVIALASDKIITDILKKEGVSDVPDLGEQAYALRTTTSPGKKLLGSWWRY